MSRIRALLLIGLISALWPASARAKDISYRRSWSLNRRADFIVGVLTDYNNYCDKGCKYRYPGVKQALIAPLWKSPDSFYVWTFVQDLKNSEWFSHVTIARNGDRTVVRFTMIGDQRVKALERATGKPHDPIFDVCDTEYDIREVFAGGKFIKTELTFSARVAVSGLIALFSGAVRSGLRDTADAIFKNVTGKT